MVCFLQFSLFLQNGRIAQQAIPAKDVLKLPGSKNKSKYSVEETLLNRRSGRNYKNKSISLEELSPILWAALGKTGSGGKRTASSTGA